MATLVENTKYSRKYRLWRDEWEWIEGYSKRLLLEVPHTFKKTICGRSPLEIKVEGYAAEYAVAWHFGVPWQDTVRETRDSGTDLVIVRAGLEVGLGIKSRDARSTYFSNFMVGAYELQNVERIPDWWIFSKVDQDSRTVQIVGTIDLERLEGRELRRMREGGPLNYVVNDKELLPVPPAVMPSPAEDKKRFFRSALRRNTYRRMELAAT